MATGFRLKDGRLINIDFIMLVTVPDVSGNVASFTIEFSHGKTIGIRGATDDVVKEHTEVRRAMGIADTDLTR